MGLASAWALKRAGRDVTVLEQYEVGHPFGSSHGASRIFRFAYSETEWVALAQEALPLWRELEAESGTEVLSLTGLLDSSGDSAALRSALDACSAEYEVLERGRSGATVRHRAGGRGRAGAARRHRPSRPRARSVLAGHRDPERGSSPRPSGERGRRGAGDVGRHGRGRARRRRRRSLGDALAGRRGDRAGDERLPGDRRVLRPPGGGRRCRRSSTGSRTPAATRTRFRPARTSSRSGCTTRACRSSPASRGQPDPEVVEAESEWVRRRYPAADPTPRGAETCLYTNIEEDRFVTERHGTIIDCSACSGHGFKFAPAVGARVAALA